jgi:hypothetical protein
MQSPENDRDDFLNNLPTLPNNVVQAMKASANYISQRDNLPTIDEFIKIYNEKFRISKRLCKGQCEQHKEKFILLASRDNYVYAMAIMFAPKQYLLLGEEHLFEDPGLPDLVIINDINEYLSNANKNGLVFNKVDVTCEQLWNLVLIGTKWIDTFVGVLTKMEDFETLLKNRSNARYDTLRKKYDGYFKAAKLSMNVVKTMVINGNVSCNVVAAASVPLPAGGAKKKRVKKN